MVTGSSLGDWNWLILGAVFLRARAARARRLHAVARALARCWSAIISFAPSLVRGRRSSSPSRCSSIASIPLWRCFARKVEKPVDRPFLNRRAEGYRRPRVHAGKADRRRRGTMRIDDTVWRVTGPDCPAGSRVKVARADGARLVVEAAYGDASDPSGRSSDEHDRRISLGQVTQLQIRHPARSRSCKCTMPTGLPASATISAVIFEELSISSASLTSWSRPHGLRRRAS